MEQLTPQQLQILGLKYENLVNNMQSAQKYGIPKDIPPRQFLRILALILKHTQTAEPIRDLNKIVRRNKLDYFQQLAILLIIYHYGINSKEIADTKKILSIPQGKRALEQIATLVCRKGVRENGGITKEDYRDIIEEFPAIALMGKNPQKKVSEKYIRKNLQRLYMDEKRDIFMPVGDPDLRLELAVQRVISPSRSKLRKKGTINHDLRQQKPEAERQLYTYIGIFLVIALLFFTPETEAYVKQVPGLAETWTAVNTITNLVTPTSYRLLPQEAEFVVVNRYDITSQVDGTTFSLTIYKPKEIPYQQDLLEFTIDTDDTGFYSKDDQTLGQTDMVKWTSFTVDEGERVTIATRARI